MSSIPVDAMAVGVFGHLDADERIWGRHEDCYIVFHALSAIMGHLSPAAADDPTRGLWGMNDAGGPWLGPDQSGRRGQFQVQPESDATGPLPIEPFTLTATATVERFGALALHGLDYYLPSAWPGPRTGASRRAGAGSRSPTPRRGHHCGSPSTRVTHPWSSIGARTSPTRWMT